MFFFIASYAGIASAERLSRHSRRANSCMEQMVLTSELSGEDAHLENALFARYQRCILRARSAESDAPRLGDKIGRLIVKAVVKSESISLKMTKFWVILGSTIAQGLSDSLSSLKTKISETESALSQQLQEYQVAHTQSELAEVRHELKQLKKKAALLKEKAAKLSQKLNKKVDKAQQKKKVCKGDLVL
ncbi:MAG: hypothetical protein KDD55_04700, partial [Bdellovibrionales bacterium]|nr:hypothetical protein [Bdellovibrionales bacterium]